MLTITQSNNIESIFILHQKIFNTDFPVESYFKKLEKYKIYYYLYSINNIPIGYSAIVDQSEEQNFYVWYSGILYEYQGNGITNIFLDYLIKNAQNINYKSITIASNNNRPHMLRLLIKRGFEIYDLKKREYVPGNKIYFKYNLHKSSQLEIDIDMNSAEIEEQLVISNRNNCNQIVLTTQKNFLDEKIIYYIIKYCNSFEKKPNIMIEFTFPLIEHTYENIKNKYTGNIQIINSNE